ncbi:MAG: toll/interleukin-1 receptor domain-containing protein [Fibromonadaceae bacterium]|jgi:hypothetical protein|nr:toll/interleukin-1 receptor domain-containing protein [Fibromonadaceae bacterium]
MSKMFEVFVSYRRKGGYDTAKLIYDRLRMDGYSVSFDIDTLVNGNFDAELEQRVNDCKDFLLVLSPGIFDRFSEADPNYDPENDWVRREIICAIKANKNIVPLALEGFVFPKTLPDEVKEIAKKNTIDIYPKYFEAAYAKMKSFLISKPHWLVRHKKKIIIGVSIVLVAIASLFYFEYKGLQEANAAAEKRRQERRKEKTLHWNGNGSVAEQVIFEKITKTGVKRTECSSNGIVLTPNTDRISCRKNEEMKVICSYSPQIRLKICGKDAVIEILEMNERLKTEPQSDSAKAMEELVDKLKAADFSEWVSSIEKAK